VKLGLSSYTFGWGIGVPGAEPGRPMDEHGLLDRCREHGLKLLQIGDNLPLHTFDSQRLKQLAARANQEGVELEVGARGLTVERVAEYAEIARRLNARLIRCVIDDANYHPTADEVTDILLRSQRLLDGLTLGIENHDRFPSKILARIIQETNSARIGICLDTANSLGGGEGLESVLPALASRTVNLHIKDFQVERVAHLMGFSVRGCPAGAGLVDLPGVLKQLTPFHRCHTAILELWTPPESRLEDTIAKEAAWAGQSIQYLRPFFS
jgi:sugar phosphate isomerase/epimerase